MVYALEVRKVLWITLLLNIFGAIVKIFYGYLAGINSIQADGVHSLFDGASNVIGLIGIWLASKPPDGTHHYGYKKFETMATVGIATLLFIACIEVFKKAAEQFLSPKPLVVTDLSFGIVIVTMGINLFVTTYEYRRGKTLKSDFLVADAKHTMSDLLASFVVLISLTAGRMGYPIIDPIATLVIAVMIGHLGYDIIKEASHVLVDASPLISSDMAKIEAIANSVEGVRECHNIRVRGRGDAVHLDCHILVSPHMTMQDAHDVAERVEERIKSEMPYVIDVVIHLEPEEKGR
ncbi:MAG TPA: cation diffusion facilitator family transporter [Thermodesulfobacteriota bacterium]|nr:cation diffusion facilitator family transporter [Thermodesulfobacteriota bacterium]